MPSHDATIPSMTGPWWNQTYADLNTPSFSPPHADYHELARSLPRAARVLDIGCGDGRHSLLFAAHGCEVTAFDSEPAAIRKLRHRARTAGVAVRAYCARMEEADFGGSYDLIIAHSVLQLVERPQWSGVLDRMKDQTRPGGWNAIAVVTDTLPVESDMAPFFVGVFEEAELFSWYTDWQVTTRSAYVVDCRHGDGLVHQHSMNKVLARKPPRPRSSR